MPIELSGLNELLNSLKSSQTNLDEVRTAAIKAGAEVVRKAISRRAPVGKKRSNTWQFKAGKKYAIEHLKDNIIVSEIKGAGEDQYVEVGAEEHFFYDKMLEFGTSNMRAEPFVEPGVLDSREEAMSEMAGVVKKAIGSGE